jgi:hypothetical protein
VKGRGEEGLDASWHAWESGGDQTWPRQSQAVRRARAGERGGPAGRWGLVAVRERGREK